MKKSVTLNILAFTLLMASHVSFASSYHYQCEGNARNTHLGKYKEFSLFINESEAKLTDLDGLWLRGEFDPDQNSYVMPRSSSRAGNYWDEKNHGYMNFSQRGTDFLVSYQESPGTFSTETLTCGFILETGADHQNISTTYKALKALGEASNISHSKVGHFNVESLDLEHEQKDLDRKKFEGCTWTTTQSRENIIHTIRTLNEDQFAANVLQDFSDHGEIIAITGLESDGDISCSRYFYRIFHRNGVWLDLNYDHSAVIVTAGNVAKAIIQINA